MAAVLRIENYAATSYVDFLSDDIKIERGGPSFKLDPNDTQTTTVFRLRFNASTAAGIRTDFNELMVLLDQAKKWHRDDLESDSVWLRWAANGETAKRSLIYDYGITNNAGVALDPLQLINKQLAVDLAITHDTEGEDVTALNWLKDVTYYGDNHGYFQLYDDTDVQPPGDRGARFGMFGFYTSAGTEKIWLGMREFNHYIGTVPGFPNFVWDFDDATSIGAGAVETTSTGSHGTNVLEVDFSTGGGTDALANRASMNLADFIISFTETMIGEYTVLLRYKLEADTDVAVRMGSSDSPLSSTRAAYNSMQYDLDADGVWHWLELGNAKFPRTGMRQLTIEAAVTGSADGVSGSTLWIDVERISGTGSVFLDCLQLIPYENHISIADLGIEFTYTRPTYILTQENFVVETVTRSSVVSEAVHSVGSVQSLNDWRFPNTQHVLVCWAIEGANGSVSPGTSFTIRDIKLFRRWAGYNGD